MRTKGLTLGEAVVGGALLIVAALAWSSRALATFSRHSLAAVVGATLVLLLPLGFALRQTRVRVFRAEAVCLARLACLCLGSTLPGWFRAFGDLDPGVYLAHAAYISRTGSLAMDDPVIDSALDLPWADASGRPHGGTRFPGYYVQPQHPRRVVPQYLLAYLQVDPDQPLDLSGRPNVSGILANPVWRLLWSRTNGVRALLRPHLPRELRHRGGGFFASRKMIRPKLQAETRRMLTEGFRDDILKLQDLIGRDLSAWLR